MYRIEKWRKVQQKFIVLGVLMLITSLPAMAAATAGEKASAVIMRFQASLIHAMKNAKQLGFKGRYQILDPAVKISHNLPFIAQFTLGPYWSRLNVKQQAEFVHTFSHLTIATYAAEFNGYSGEQFKVTSVHVVAGNRVIVETELLGSKGNKDAVLDYLLIHSPQGWRIVNIVANGVSDLALKRAQYTAIMRKSGFNVLIHDLAIKIKAMSSAHKAAA